MYIKKINKLVILILCFMIISVGCSKDIGKTSANNKDESKEEVKATLEPCVFLNEWDSSLFEVFGFPALDIPLNAYYPAIEKGRTYLIGEFYTDELDIFLIFFKDIYQIMWGQIVDAMQVLEEKDGVYSFEGEYVVKDIYRQVVEDGYDLSGRPEKNAFIKVSYNENERKCVLECRMLKSASRKNNKTSE